MYVIFGFAASACKAFAGQRSTAAGRWSKAVLQHADARPDISNRLSTGSSPELHDRIDSATGIDVLQIMAQLSAT